MGHVVGIDLGTTNSLVAWVKNGAPEVIRDQSGDALLPSVVSVGEDGTLFVGREAQRRLLTAPSRTVYSVKRFMGRGIDDVRDEAALLPFGIGGEPGGVVRIDVAGREFTPPEISAFVLRELKHRAEEFFREQGEFDFEVDRAVITVPAYFNDAQRTATRDAGRIAGLEVLRIINEPTAASLAYGLDKKNRGTIAVYDLGGGTFDISILKVEDGVFQVLSTNGDTHLGGDDIDQLLMRVVLREIASRSEGQLRPYPVEADLQVGLIQAVRKAVIQAKVDLSDQEEAEIVVDPSSDLPQGFRRRMTRREFEALIEPLVERTLGPVRQALEDAGLEPRDIDEAVMVGGSTRIPIVRSKVADLFGRPPHTELNPDEVVALGAAVQADILVSGRREMLLLDVTPLSLGIETMGGVTSKIINRNSTIPASGREMFTTGVDNQTAVDVHVLQGERTRGGLPIAGAVQAARDSTDAGRAGPHRGPLPDRRQRHPQRGRQRAADRHRADDRGQAVLRPDRGRGRADAHRVVRARRGRLRGAAPDRRAERSGDGHPRHREVAAQPGPRGGGARGAEAGRAGPHPDGAGRPQAGHECDRPGSDSREDARAEPCDAPSGGSDDEPQRPRGACWKERNGRVTP
jgi:molecular chaperone DnaK